MANEAPLYVPTEIRRKGGDPLGPRWFRLAILLSEDSVRLRSGLPEELRDGPLTLSLHLPWDSDDRDPADPEKGPLSLTGRAGEVIVDAGEETEHAELRLVHLHGVPESTRDRIRRYVELRLASDLASGQAAG